MLSYLPGSRVPTLLGSLVFLGGASFSLRQSGKGQAKGVASMSSHTLCNDFTKWPRVSFPGLPRYPPKAIFQHLWLEVGSVWSGLWGRDPEVENGC